MKKTTLFAVFLRATDALVVVLELPFRSRLEVKRGVIAIQKTFWYDSSNSLLRKCIFQ